MDEAIQTKTGLNGNQLKLIAIIAMTVDHLAWVLFPGYSLQPAAIALHLLGRIAAPVFCFFIAEGFFYTHDLKKYILRLLLFAIPSHFAYLFCFGHSFVPDSISTRPACCGRSRAVWQRWRCKKASSRAFGKRCF